MGKFITFISLFLPSFAFAHEVYVLDAATVEHAMSVVSPNPFDAYIGNEGLFIFWGIVSTVVFLTVIAASCFHIFEKRIDPIFFKLKRYALPIARVTVGLCFIVFSITGNIYGSELYLSKILGAGAPLIQLLCGVAGVMAVLGMYTRLAGIAMLALYALLGATLGSYVLTYTDFLGAALLLTILGGGMFSFDNAMALPGARAFGTATRSLQQYAFPLLRLCFGWGVLYASVYAKFIHSQLALDVVNTYDLTRFFPFDPLFVVLGALIIEFICGVLLIAGIAVRWTLLFLAFWLTLSLLYFQELIWPHGILFGLAIALFLHGYDRYSLQGRILKSRGHESVF